MRNGRRRLHGGLSTGPRTPKVSLGFDAQALRGFERDAMMDAREYVASCHLFAEHPVAAERAEMSTRRALGRSRCCSTSPERDLARAAR